MGNLRRRCGAVFARSPIYPRRCSRHWISPDNSKRQTRDFKILPKFQIACVTVAAVGLIALDFPTFSRHTIILTNSPGRLELFGAEITKRTVRPFALIPNCNPFKDRTSRLRSSLQLHILNKFFLQRCPKNFQHCVVIKPPARHAYGTQRLRSYSPQARNKNCVSASASHSKSTRDFEHSILGVCC